MRILKNIGVVLSVLVLSCSSVFASVNVYWQTQNALSSATPDVLSPVGVAIPMDSTWIVQLIRVSDGQAIADSSSDGFAWGSGMGDGQFFTPLTFADSFIGTAVYTRFFNASTVGAATHLAESSDKGTGGTVLTWTANTPPNPPANIDYMIPGTITAGSWQVVPEPSTVGLVLVGIGILGYRRFRK